MENQSQLRRRLCALGVFALLVSVAAAQTQTTTQAPVKMKVSPAIEAKASSPVPGATAKKVPATSIGKGKASYSGKGHAKGDQVFWVEEVDIDGDGNMEEVDFALDEKRKVLYMSDSKTFTCANGQSAEGDVLMAVYAKGNTMAKPVGSGWYVVDLDAMECAVQAAGLYGCKFDASGNLTECGAATIQEETDEVVIVAAPRRQ